jgi:hypothetical protein
MDKGSTMKKLNVLGNKIAVKISSCENPNHAGEFHPYKNLILIDPKFNNKAHTFFHEYNHVIWDRAGLNQTNIGTNIQEILCETFATAYTENFINLIDIYNKLTKYKIK